MASIHIALQLLRRTMGSTRDVLLYVLLPAILLSSMVGLFASIQDDRVDIIVNNADTGLLGEYLIRSLEPFRLYELNVQPDWTEQELKNAVLDGKADGAVFIPENFTQNMLDGEKSEAIFYRMDEQLWNASLSTTLTAEANRLTASVMLTRSAGGDNPLDMDKLIALLQAQESPAVTMNHTDSKLGQIISNPIMVGLIIMFLFLLVSQLISFVIEDREKRTMARMYTAPVRAIEIAFGNFLGSVIIGTIQLVIILSLVYFVAGYSQGISFWSMLLVMEFFLLAVVGVVSAVAGMVRNSSQLLQVNTLIIMPTCLISGSFFPLSRLPGFIQRLANFTPQKWTILALDRLGGGSGLSGIVLPLVILLLYAVVMIAFGSAVLKPNRKSTS